MSTNISNVEVNNIGVRARGQRRRVQTVPEGKSKTKQSDKDQADIHKIIAKFERTGLLPQRKATPLQGEMPQVDSFTEAMDVIITAQQTFESLPSDIRQKFENDPKEFLDFVGNPENEAEMIQLGLKEKPVVEETQPEQPTEEPQAPPEVTE